MGIASLVGLLVTSTMSSQVVAVAFIFASILRVLSAVGFYSCNFVDIVYWEPKSCRNLYNFGGDKLKSVYYQIIIQA